MSSVDRKGDQSIDLGNLSLDEMDEQEIAARKQLVLIDTELKKRIAAAKEIRDVLGRENFTDPKNLVLPTSSFGELTREFVLKPTQGYRVDHDSIHLRLGLGTRFALSWMTSTAHESPVAEVTLDIDETTSFPLLIGIYTTGGGYRDLWTNEPRAVFIPTTAQSSGSEDRAKSIVRNLVALPRFRQLSVYHELINTFKEIPPTPKA